MPPTVVAPGDDVTFTFEIDNLSNAYGVTIDTLVDSVFGDLNGQGTCSVPQVIPPMASYSCSLTSFVGGNPGDIHTNTAQAAGNEDDVCGLPVEAMDAAQVQIVDEVIEGCPHCPAKVTFRNGLDFYGVQGEIPLPANFNPTAGGLTISLSNQNGVIYSGTLLPGDLVNKGRKWQFKDKAAKTGGGFRDGIFKVQMKLGKSGLWRIKAKAFADLSAATLPEMTINISIGGNVFARTAIWNQRAKGWIVKRLPLP